MKLLPIDERNNNHLRDRCKYNTTLDGCVSPKAAQDISVCITQKSRCDDHNFCCWVNIIQAPISSLGGVNNRAKRISETIFFVIFRYYVYKYKILGKCYLLFNKPNKSNCNCVINLKLTQISPCRTSFQKIRHNYSSI